ncbi:MAG: Gfo/Idh/MocA family oxidoreductase [Chloroflexota bacterium]
MDREPRTHQPVRTAQHGGINNTRGQTMDVPAEAPGADAPLRVAVVGCGYWGPNLIRNFAALPQATLVAACDLSQERLQAIGAQYPDIRLTTSYAELLNSDVDAIAIATPVRSHYPLVKQALQAGKHVLVEKPLTGNVADGMEVVELAERNGLILMVDHTFLFEPAVEALRDLVQSGELGDIWQVSAARLNLGLIRPDANVVWDLAPHDISILLEVLGADPLTVSARGVAHVQPGIPEVAYLELGFPKNVMAHVNVSWLEPSKVRRITIVGSRKMAVYNDTLPDKLRVFDRSVVATETDEGSRELSYRFGETTSVSLPKLEPLRRQAAHFVACIRQGETPRVDGRQGLRVVQILELADRSLHNGGHRETVDADATRVSKISPFPRRDQRPGPIAAAR